jgi:hypothetical protein
VPVPTHFRFTARGFFFNTPEQWSIGFHMSRDQAAGPDADLGQVNEGQVTTAFAAFMNSGVIATTVRLQDWRCYQIGTDGRMEGNGPLLHDYAGTPVQGNGIIKYPPQVSLKATFVAPNRGPAKLGGFYIPGPTADLQNDLRLSTTDATAAITAVTNLLKGVSNAIDLPNTILSAHGLNVSTRGGNGSGTKQQIDHVEVGRVLDTLRTRRGALLEARQVGGHIDW